MYLLSTGSAFQQVKDNIIAFAYFKNQVINYLQVRMFIIKLYQIKAAS